MYRTDAAGGVVLFGFGVITVLLSLRLPVGTFRAAGPGLFPLILGLLLTLLAGLFLVNLRWRHETAAAVPGPAPGLPGSRKPLILFLATMALAVALWNPLGFPLVAFLLMLVLLRILGTRGWTLTLLVASVSAGLSYLLFVQWLKIPLPKGWLGL